MTIADRKEREREERRMQIISSAESLFFQNGYDQVSMDQIARNAELSKGTIFFYFKNKEALFFIIVLQGIRLFHQMVIEAINSGDMSDIGRFRSLSTVGVRFSREYPGYLSLIRQFKSGRFTIYNSDSEKDEVTEIIWYTDEMTRILEEIIRKGIQNGSFRSDLSPVELAIIIKIMLYSIMDKHPEIQWTLTEHGIKEDVLINHYLELVESVICSPYPNKEKQVY